MTSDNPNNEKRSEQAELVEITVDGRAVMAPRGQNLLDALLEAGEEISYFCYHPCLSIVAKCRQCLIGLGNATKLIPSCQLTVEPGMEIRSTAEDVLEARRAMLEYTLLNHPIDCVICDKAGECTLQRHYMDWDAKPAMINHQKVRKPKKVDLGPEIVLDAERCILCDRCVRFCDEVAKQPQLVFAERGDHTVLTTAPGERLDNPYALNTVDICPVGALTDKEFRFRSRVWDLYATRSTCNGCAAGCQMEIHHKDGQIYRMVPPKRWDMNLNWMCDYGRRTYKAIHAPERLSESLLADKPTTFEAAVERAAELLRPQSAAEGSPVGVVLGADATNEDNYAAAWLASTALNATLYSGDLADNGMGDDILRRDDPNPNRYGARALCGEPLRGRDALLADLKAKKLRALYVVGDALGEASEIVAAVGALDLLVVQATRRTPLTAKAHVTLPASAWAEVDGTICNADGALGRLRPAVEPPGFARPHWALIGAVAGAMGHTLPAASAHELFIEMKHTVAAFADAQWGEEIPTARLRWAGRRG
jgi:NADH-quinone oxidoreductase subunit G